jgi:hypothetical protein
MNRKARQPASRALAAAITALLLAAPPVAAAGDALPLRCRFDDGLRAIYILDRASWSARRPDVEPTRVATLDVTTDAYRLAFRPGDADYRIAVEIDRRDGHARRVYGPAPWASSATRRVIEKGRCRARFGGLGAADPTRRAQP